MIEDPYSPLGEEVARTMYDSIDELEALLTARKVLTESGPRALLSFLEELQLRASSTQQQQQQLPPNFRSTVQGQKFAKCLLLARKVMTLLAKSLYI